MEDITRALEVFKGAPAILEGFVDFAFEASVVAARGHGRIFLPPMTRRSNLHENHIPRRSTVLGRADQGAKSEQAKAIVMEIAGRA